MIPKKIHYCWFGYGEKNKLVQKCIASWKKYCPDYEIITSKYKLAKLHKTLVNRLEKECCYYIEKHLYSNNQIFLKLLIKANSVIDSNLIECEEDYVLPAITSLWDAGRNYMRLRNSKLVRMMRKVIKGKWFRKGKYEC